MICSFYFIYPSHFFPTLNSIFSVISRFQSYYFLSFSLPILLLEIPFINSIYLCHCTLQETIFFSGFLFYLIFILSYFYFYFNLLLEVLFYYIFSSPPISNL